MIIVEDVEQGTDEWRKLKTGVISASNFHKIISAVKGEYSKSADKYAIKLIAEKLTGEIDDTYSNAVMERGVVVEIEARNWYSISHQVRQVGFVFKDDRKLVGCSPDGLMEGKGVEIKCVIGSTMVDYLLGSEEFIVNEYKQQIQSSMFITGFNVWDLLIYHPNFDPILIEVPRDNEYIRKMEICVARLLKDIKEKIARIRK